MASIQTGIQLQDNFTNVIMGIINSVNLAVSAMYDMNAAMNSDVDTASIQAAQEELARAGAAAVQLNAALDDLSQPRSGPETPTPPAPEPAPVWQNDTMAVFTNTGIERFRQEVQDANQMIQQLSGTQDEIARQALNTNVLSPEAFQDMNAIAARIDNIRARIQQIENNPMDIGADAASAEAERLRGMLYQTQAAQDALNRAMQGMDAGDINEAYLRLSQTVSNTERYIRDNVDEQGRFNRAVQELHGPIANAENGFKGWQKAIIVANQTVGLIKSTLGRLGVMDMSGAFGRIDTMNQFQKTVTTMTGDANMANAALGRLKDTTLGTAYGLDVAASATQGFMTRGMSLGAATDQVRIWADAVSFYGKGTNEQLENVVDAIGKMYSKGKVEADQLDRLFDAGIGAAEVYAEAVGENVSAVKDELSDGSIGAQQFIDTVSRALDSGISAGAAKNAGDSWAVTFANVGASITRGWVSVIQGLDVALASQGLPSSMEMVTMFGQNAEEALNAVGNAMGVVVGAAVNIGETLGMAGSFISDNWSDISPVIYAVAAAFAAYAVILGIVNVAKGISAAITAGQSVAASVHAAALAMESGATFIATVKQYGFNAALLACPVTWIVLAIIALITALVILANRFTGAGHAASTAFGVICGGVNVVLQFFKNLGLSIANIAIGIWDALGALCENMQVAFHNAIANVQSWWYGLLETACEVIENICAALNKLPFVEFDYSGISQAADDYAAKSQEAANDKLDYVSVSEAFDRGMHTYDAFQDGWVRDAYKAGADWGDGITDKVKKMFMPDIDPLPEKDENNQPGGNGLLGNDPNDLLGQTAANTGNAADKAGDAAKHAKRAADSLDITSEDLKYLRDITETRVVDRYTTSEITVHQTNNNNINSEMDLDGVCDYMRDKVEEQMHAAAEGAH